MDVSVVIVEYKDVASLARAITSIQEIPAELSTEIIVVSNSSYTAAKQTEIRESLPGVSFIFNEDNRGFAKGVNQGIARAQGEFILLLNPDARMVDTSLSQAVRLLRANPRVAVAGPLIVDGAGQIQDSCRQFITPKILIGRTVKRVFQGGGGNLPVLEENDYRQPHPVDWVCGACLLVRKAAIADVGLLDERFFMYMEDMDWCRRFWGHGWEVWFQPSWQIEHQAGRGSASKPRLHNRLMWIHLSSLGKYVLKWYPRR